MWMGGCWVMRTDGWICIGFMALGGYGKGCGWKLEKGDIQDERESLSNDD